MSFFLLFDIINMVIKMKKIVGIFVLIIFIIILVLLYSRYIGTKGLSVKEYKISYSNLSDDFYGLKIVHLSDVHYKTLINKKELEKIVDKINSTKPDIVILSGDLFNSSNKLSNDEIDEITECLKNINASIGKFAIKGDNDIIDNWNTIISNSNFKDLNNTYELIYTNKTNYIFLAGISSNISDSNIDNKLKDIYEFLNDENNKPNYSILVMHEPDFIDQIDYDKFNLVLAGHSLNGLIKLPIIGGILKQDKAKKYYSEHYKLNNTEFYISSGLGVDKYRFRLFNKPSFNLYRITN